MGRDLTCNKALLLCITPSGCPPQHFCTCEPQWLMYVLFSSPHWRSFFSLSPLLAFFWWTPEGPNQREGICIHSLASLHARSHTFLCSPSVNHNYFLSRSTLLNVLLCFFNLTVIDSPAHQEIHTIILQRCSFSGSLSAYFTMFLVLLINWARQSSIFQLTGEKVKITSLNCTSNK